ncbi:Sec-independent protein translocase protein TatB [Microbulbifer yueqingensis]|uniref:Sec-independent protein translocase protein TatB n=1 Tax=Microbulbifer yueqingensis TaxID=658219 RepID=A0A1G9BDS6_9GAMM|nr:Sec-independent protein translocase protein TatB [Microbulbifer yueqingensis]SDK37629.1 twin arginine-targeting protein translocase TatB [Microbulbifer yueqingensis]
MFDIGFFELLLVGVVGLLVVGPERLPDAIRTTARWWSGLKRTLQNAKDELEREVGADDIRRELHNERIMRELEESRREVEESLREPSPAATRPEPQPVAETVEYNPSHPSDDAEDYLPEQDEDAEDLQDPEYPEHWHDYGDPDLVEDHPDNLARAEREEAADSAGNKDKDSHS